MKIKIMKCRVAVGVIFLCLACISAGAAGANARPDRGEEPSGTERSSAKELIARASGMAVDGRWEEACALFRAVLKDDPANTKAALGLGTCLLQMKRYQDALDVLAPLQDKLPDHIALKNNLAWIYAVSPDPALRNGAKAVRLAQQALMEVPGDADIWNTLAEAHYTAGEYAMARRAARIAVDIAQEVAPARTAGFWETLRRCEKALEREKAGSK